MKIEDGGLETTVRATVLVSQFRYGVAENFLVTRVDTRALWNLSDKVSQFARGRGKN